MNLDKDRLNKLAENARRDVQNNNTSFGARFGSYKNISSSEDLFNRVVSNDSVIAQQRAILGSATSSQSEKDSASQVLRSRTEMFRQQTEAAYNAALDTAATNNGMSMNDINTGINTANADIATQDTLIDTANANIKTHEDRLKQAGGSTK